MSGLNDADRRHVAEEEERTQGKRFDGYANRRFGVKTNPRSGAS